MGPFPHHAPPANISAQNPVGTDGFEFVEFAHPQPDALARLFARMGFTTVARHKTKNKVQNLGGCRFVSLIGKGAWEAEE